MSILSKISKGKKEIAQFYVLYGLPGLGKTTLASQFPDTVVMDLEAGSLQVSVERVEKENLTDFKALLLILDEVTALKKYKTIVIDSVTALEKLIEQDVCNEHKVKTLSDVAWGGGPIAVQQKLHELIEKLKHIQMNDNVNIIVIAHSQIKSFVDPTHNQSYDRHILQCNQKFGQMLIANADHVFFCAYAVDFTKDSKTKKTQAFSTGDRVIYTSWRASHEAKTRFDIPYEIDMDYASLKKAIEESKPQEPSKILEVINSLLLKTNDLTRQKVEIALKDANNDSVKLKRIKDKLETMVTA